MSDLANFKLIYNSFVKQVSDELLKGEFKELVKKKYYFDEKIYSNRMSEVERVELIKVLNSILSKTVITFRNFEKFEYVINEIIKKDKAFKYAFKYELSGIEIFTSAKIKLSFLNRLSLVDCLKKLILFLEKSDFESYKSYSKKISEFYLEFRNKMISELSNDYGKDSVRKLNVVGVLLGISFIFTLEVFVINSDNREISYNKYVSWVDRIDSDVEVEKQAQLDFSVEFIGEYNYYNEERLLHNILKNYFKDVKFLHKIGVEYVVISPFDFEGNDEKYGLHGHYNSEFNALMLNDLYNSKTNYSEKLKTRFHEIFLAYVNFLKKTGNLREFEKLWCVIDDGGNKHKNHKKSFLEDVVDLSEIIGFILLTKYNESGKFLSLDKVISNLSSDVRLQYSKNYNELFSKIKLLYKFNFIPKHITFKARSEMVYN